MTNETSMSLGRDWAGEDVAGWIATEKFDGVRVRWDGSAMWTRSGRRVDPPEILLAATACTLGLPSIPLDCEIWGGYGPAGYEAARGAANRGVWDPGLRLAVFDAPGVSGCYAERLAFARCVTALVHSVVVPDLVAVDGIDTARALMRKVHARGGEGIILRPPDCGYVTGRRGFLKLTR